MRQFRIGEHAVGNQSSRRYAFTASDAVMNDAEIIHTNVSELRAACHLADCPNTGCSRGQPLVYFDVTAISQFNARQLQSNSFCVRSPPGGDEQMTAL